MKAGVEVFIFREKAFLTRQAVVELRPGILVFGKHVDLGFDRLRIVQRSRRYAIMVFGAMKSERATTARTVEVRLRELVEGCCTAGGGP